MKNLIVLLFLLPTILVGCVHTYMRGTVAMKVDENHAHVCLGKGSVKLGQKIVFYDNECDEGVVETEAGGAQVDSASCKMKKLGYGTITKVLNNHYSTVKLDKEFKFKEGQLVEVVEK